MPMLFCSNCSDYLPSGAECPRCHAQRPELRIPSPPSKSIWQAQAPGGVASRMVLVRIASDHHHLIVPWAYLPRGGGMQIADGGVLAIDVDNGRVIWSQRLGMPIEGGAVVVEDVIVVGLGMRGPGAGEGSLAVLDVHTGEERWRRRLGGAVRCAPVADGGRVYASACDGAAYCFDAHTGQQVWRALVAAEGTPMPASPLLVRERGMLQLVIIATYGGPHGRDEGKVAALNEHGKLLWQQSAGGNVRATPEAYQGALFVTAFRNSPSVGILSAFELRTGRPNWEQPFKVQAQQPSDRTAYNFSASPMARDGKVYVGALSHQVFALDAATGHLVWDSQHSIGAGVATRPAWVEGLVVVGANDGRLCALDAATGQKCWEHTLGGPVLTDPLERDGLIFAGADNGDIAALPWHNGEYAWAAERLEQAGRFDDAGDYHALAAHFSLHNEARTHQYQLAVKDWGSDGKLDKAAALWLSLDRSERAAEMFREAGEHWRMLNPDRAAVCFQRAADLYRKLRQPDPLNECTRALASCARLPYVHLAALNVGAYIQWQQGELTLRLLNDAAAPIPSGVRLWLGGALKSLQEAHIASAMLGGQAWNIPLSIVPTKPDSALEVEVEYDSGIAAYGLMHGMLTISIQAIEPRAEPLNIGDVTTLHVTINGATAEGLAIQTRDIGTVKSGAGIQSVQAQGDVGAIISRPSAST